MICSQRVVCLLSMSLGKGMENTQRNGWKPYKATNHWSFFYHIRVQYMHYQPIPVFHLLYSLDFTPWHYVNYVKMTFIFYVKIKTRVRRSLRSNYPICLYKNTCAYWFANSPDLKCRGQHAEIFDFWMIFKAYLIKSQLMHLKNIDIKGTKTVSVNFFNTSCNLYNA
jgi:hypothetical protein